MLMKTRCLIHCLNEELALRLPVCYLETPTRLCGGVVKAVIFFFKFKLWVQEETQEREVNSAPPAQVLQDVCGLLFFRACYF